MVTVAPLAKVESASTSVTFASSTTGDPPEVYSFTGVVATTDGRLVDTGKVATVTVTSPGALGTPLAVNTIVTGFTPTLAVDANVTDRSAAWYSVMEALPVSVNT